MTKRTDIQTAALGMMLALITVLWLIVPQASAADENRLKGPYSFRMVPVKSFSSDAPGDPAGLASAPRQDILRVGVFTADGKGNLQGHTVATTDTNTGATWIITFDWTGKYTLNADGTGFFSVDTISNLVCTDTTVSHTGNTPHPAAVGGTPLAGNISCPADVEGHEDYAFVFSTPGGKRMEFIQTDNDGGGAKVFLTGVATAHEALRNKGENGEEEED